MNKYNPENALQDFLTYLIGVKRHSSRTVKAYEYDLRVFITGVRVLGINDITREHIESYLSSIPSSDKGSTANYNRKLSALHSFFQYLEDRGFNNPTKDFKPAKNHKRQISYLTEEERSELLKTVGNKATPFYKKRDLAIFSIFLNVGIRVSELVNLELKDIELRNDGCSYIRVIRKGGSEDKLPISESVASRLSAYLGKRPNIKSNKVFLSKNQKPLSPNSVYYLVKKYLKKSGIRKEKMGPHILRHTVGVSLLKKGVDLVTIQKILGHKRLDTTSIYLHIESEDIAQAINLISI